MRLLFIKLKHIGDALLLTPTLKAVREAYPQAQIWVVVREGTQGILEGCPQIDRLLTAPAPEKGRRRLRDWFSQIQLVRELRREKFDIAFELSDGDRGRWLAWLSGAVSRLATRHYVRLNWVARHAITRFSDTPWTEGHRVEKDYALVRECLDLPEVPPELVFTRDRSQLPQSLVGFSRCVVFHPSTRWVRKQWPVELWVRLGKQMQARGLRVLVSCGPDAEERAIADAICEGVGGGIASTDGATRWAELAGVLYRAALFVGVDTAAMHLAAACQCPTVAIFGPSVPRFWRPWRNSCHLISAPESELALARPDFLEAVSRTSAASVSYDRVLAACEELLSAQPVVA